MRGASSGPRPAPPDLSTLTLPELHALNGALRAAIRSARRPSTAKETTMTIFNKSDLAHDVAAILGISQTSANQVITEALHLILGAAAVGDGYRLQGFGTFRPKTTAARTGRNPRTGEAVAIPARTALTFKAAKPGKAGL